MTEKTPPQPAIDINKVKNKLLQQKTEITRLENEVTRLQEEIAQNQTEQHRIISESQLATDDSELARSFNQKNYAPIIQALFEKPSKQLRNGAFVIILFFVAAALAAGYFSSGYLTYTHNIIIDEKLDVLQDQFTRLIKQQQLQQEVVNKNLALAELEREAFLISNASVSASVTAAPAITENANIQRKNRIAEQADAIFRHIRTAEKQEGFLNNYVNDKTQFAQLYLFVMQYASNEDIYYESYLEVIKTLNISPSIAPKTVDDLLDFDLNFLQATYSGLLITSNKKRKGWRYRKEDGEFSSYYNSDLNYDLGSREIAIDNKDYKQLPSIFAFNINRITQQIIFNDRENKLQLPKKIYYIAYSEPAKNDAIKKLLNQEKYYNDNGVLTIDASLISLPINNNIKKKLTERLTANGFSLAGDSLTTSINKYRESKRWNENGVINLKLLNLISLYPTYKDLQLP